MHVAHACDSAGVQILAELISQMIQICVKFVKLKTCEI